MNGAGGLYMARREKKAELWGWGGIRWKRHWEAFALLDKPLEMETFLLLSRLKEQDWEETNTDSYGCLKEWDKENRKEERKETRSVRERMINWSAKVAEYKRGPCCQ